MIGLFGAPSIAVGTDDELLNVTTTKIIIPERAGERGLNVYLVRTHVCLYVWYDSYHPELAFPATLQQAAARKTFKSRMYEAGILMLYGLWYM